MQNVPNVQTKITLLEKELEIIEKELFELEKKYGEYKIQKFESS